MPVKEKYGFAEVDRIPLQKDCKKILEFIETEIKNKICKNRVIIQKHRDARSKNILARFFRYLFNDPDWELSDENILNNTTDPDDSNYFKVLLSWYKSETKQTVRRLLSLCSMSKEEKIYVTSFSTSVIKYEKERMSYE